MKSKNILSALLAVAAFSQAARAEFVAEHHDGTRVAVANPVVMPSGDSYLIGGIPVEQIKKVWHNPVTQDPSPLPVEGTRRVAVIDMNARNGEVEDGSDNSRNLYSAEYMADVAGMPWFSTDNLDRALAGADMIVMSSRVHGGRNPSFTDEEWGRIADWVAGGGVLVAPSLESSVSKAVSALFGLEAVQSQQKNHSSITWSGSKLPELAYFDEPEELSTCIGKNLIHTTEYTPASGAEALATYDGGNAAAVVKNRHGDGAVYTVGVKWRDVIQRPQLNKDDSSHASSNAFVPGADIYALFLRAVYAANREVALWKYTVPEGYESVLVPTHDCDSSTAYEAMHYMGDYEHSLGVDGHYFLTVHYYRDPGYMSQFYNAANIALAKKLLAQGHTVGSHSIGHFPDFSNADRFPMTVVTEEGYAAQATNDINTGVTTGGSTWAEIVMSKQILERDLGNKVRAFRSGHLCVNKLIPEALRLGGYEFTSCYTASDVMCGTPYFTRIQNDWTGELTGVLQMPLHFSDVYSSDKMDETNWAEKVTSWREVQKKYRGNLMSSIILIHPNRDWKMEAEKMLVEMMDLSREGLYNFQDYGDFWVKRGDFDFDYAHDASTGRLVVKATAASIAANSALCLMIEAPAGISSVTLIDEKGDDHPARVTSPSAGRYLIHLK